MERVFGAQAGEVMPETLSVAVQLTVTSLVYQPLAPRVPAGVPTTTGREASRLTVTLAVAEPPAEVAVQV